MNVVLDMKVIIKHKIDLKKKNGWENMPKDVELLLKTCYDCQMNRPQPINSSTKSFTFKLGLSFNRVGLDIKGLYC